MYYFIVVIVILLAYEMGLDLMKLYKLRDTPEFSVYQERGVTKANLFVMFCLVMWGLILL